MLLVQSGGPRPFRIVQRFSDLDAVELVRTFLVVAGRSEPVLDLHLLRDMFPQLKGVSPHELVTAHSRYYFFPESEHGSWNVPEVPRGGSPGSGALYLADWHGAEKKLFAMVQVLGGGESTSRHAHYAEGVQEFWCVTAGSAVFTLERNGVEVGNLISLGDIITARQGEIHQTVADVGEDFEAVLVVRGTNRSAHTRDHHFVSRQKGMPRVECSLTA